MPVLGIHTAPGGLMALALTATAETLDAYFYTFTKAQMVARAANPDPTSPAYFKAMVYSLGTLGWKVSAVPEIRLSEGQAGTSPLQTCMSAVADAALATVPGTRQGQIHDGAAAFEAALGDAPPEVTEQLDEWWAQGAIAADAHMFTVGPIIQLGASPIIPTANLQLSVRGASWRSMLSPGTPFSCAIKPVLLKLKWPAYNAIRDALHEELASSLADNVRSANLDLEAAQLEFAP